MKIVKYENWGYPLTTDDPCVRVGYLFIGDSCYYSGLQTGTSTVNAAEEVIDAICRAEGIKPNQARFFDLLTHRMYETLFPGTYKLWETVIRAEKRGGYSIRWKHDVPCPPEVEEYFREHIGTLPEGITIRTPAEAEQAGFQPTVHSANSIGELLQVDLPFGELASEYNRTGKIDPDEADMWGHDHVLVQEETGYRLWSLSGV